MKTTSQISEYINPEILLDQKDLNFQISKFISIFDGSNTITDNLIDKHITILAQYIINHCIEYGKIIYSENLNYFDKDFITAFRKRINYTDIAMNTAIFNFTKYGYAIATYFKEFNDIKFNHYFTTTADYDMSRILLNKIQNELFKICKGKTNEIEINFYNYSAIIITKILNQILHPYLMYVTGLQFIYNIIENKCKYFKINFMEYINQFMWSKFCD